MEAFTITVLGFIASEEELVHPIILNSNGVLSLFRTIALVHKIRQIQVYLIASGHLSKPSHTLLQWHAAIIGRFHIGPTPASQRANTRSAALYLFV